MTNAPILFAGLASIVLSADNQRQLASVRVGDLKHPPNWIRQDAGTQEELIALARSYQSHPVNLIVVSPDGVIRDGNRRIAAIIADTGPDTEVRVIVTTEEITEAVALEIMIETAEHTKALSPYELYVGCSKWLAATGKSAKELATKIHRSEATVSLILSLSKCIPSVVEAAQAGRIGISDWAAISRSPEQQATLDLKLGGATRDDLNRRAKKPKAAAPAEKASSIKCPLPSGHVVTIKGNDLSLEETLDVLKEAMKAIKHGVNRGFTAKTFQAAAKDIAAAG